MKSKIFEIETCNDCPFMKNDYDEWVIGNDTVVSCNLNIFLMKQFSFIDSFKSNEKKEPIIQRPNWCPLINKQLTFKIKKK